jgi:hypothetical protein
MAPYENEYGSDGVRNKEPTEDTVPSIHQSTRDLNCVNLRARILV